MAESSLKENEILELSSLNIKIEASRPEATEFQEENDETMDIAERIKKVIEESFGSSSMSPGSSFETTKIKNEVDTDPVEVAENVGEDFDTVPVIQLGSRSLSDPNPVEENVTNDSRELEEASVGKLLEIFEVESDNIRSLPIPSTSNVTSYETRIRATYEPFLPPEILSSLSTFQCGLCQQEMASLKVAWQHYTGEAHIRTVKSFLGRNYTIHPEKIDQPSYLADRHEWPGWRAGDHQSRAGHRNTVELWREGNHRGHPPFPAMLHQYLDTVQPASLDNKLEEIVEWMCANYSVGRDRDKVKERVVWSVENLVSRQQQRWRFSAQQWTCSYQDCRNSNFGWRKYCNRCRQPKSLTKLSGRKEIEKSNSVKLFPEDLRNDIERKRNFSGATSANSNDSFVKPTRTRKEQLSLYSKSYRGGSRGWSRERREQPREKERRHESTQRSRSLMRSEGPAIGHSRNNRTRSKSGSRRRSPRRYKTCSHTHYSSSHLSKTSRGTTYSYSYKEKSRERSTERAGCRERFRERSRERSREICRLSERVERRRRSPIREERYEGRECNPTSGRGSDLQGAPPPTSFLTQHPQFPNVFILNTLPPGRGLL